MEEENLDDGRAKIIERSSSTYSNRGMLRTMSIHRLCRVACYWSHVLPSARYICEYFSRRAVPPNYAMRSSRSHGKIGFPHHWLSSLEARQISAARGRTAFKEGEDKLMICNSAVVKIPQPPAPTSEKRRDAWTAIIELSRCRLLSAIPPRQKSAGTLRKCKVEVSFLTSFFRRIYDQLSAIEDDTNTGVLWKCTPRGRALGYTDWKYHHECANHARSISYSLYRYTKIILNLVGFQKDESFKNFILVIFKARYRSP